MMIKKPVFLLVFFIPLVFLGSAQETNETVGETLVDIDGTSKVEKAWFGDQSTFQIQSDIPKLVTITDINSIDQSGAGKVNFKQVRLDPGTQNITMDLEPDGSSYGVTIATSENMVFVSNPEKPYFASITVSDLYTTPWIMGTEMLIFVIIIIKWRKYKWGKQLRRVA